MSSVLVAMSGGVDSSVAAALLLRQGWEVVGVTMKLWGGASDTGCCSVADVDDARRVAQQLGIDHHVFNFTEDFERHVVAPYVEAHGVGETPNPCIECNRHLKFDRLLRRADDLGFDAIATGHHARIVGGRVARGADRLKDQSYVVHVLDAAARARTLLPVGELIKSEVRELAGSMGLRTALKAESQDVCFITSASGRARFLGDRIALRAGTVVTTDGEVVGAVPAVELVTIGQRRGLGLPGGSDAQYAVGVDVEAAVVTVGGRAELLTDVLPLRSVQWADGRIGGDVLVQCSAHGRAHPATVEEGGGGSADAQGRSSRLALRWHEPQRRVAPGQSVVLYDPSDTYVLGAGIAAPATTAC